MEIKQLLEELEKFTLNEMAIYYGTDHGTVKDISEGFKKLSGLKEGMVKVNQCLCVEKIVTQQEIDNGLFDAVQKDIPVVRQYPIVMVWGEPDKRKGTKHLEGHGIVHLLQGHGSNMSKVFPTLQQAINRNITAKYDKYGNYTIKVKDYRFAFMLVDKEDLTPDHAVLVTAFKK